jgi:hypothetical protein
MLTDEGDEVSTQVLQGLNVDVYIEDLKIIKDILTFQGYNIHRLEEQIFEELEDDIIPNTSLRITDRERQQEKHRRSESNVQLNESLAIPCSCLR